MNFLVNHQTAPPSNSSFPKLVIKFWTQSYCSHTILCAIYPLDVCVYSSSCVSLGKMFQIKKINNPAPNQQTHGNNVDSQNPTEVRSMVKSNHQKKMVQLEAFSVVGRTKKRPFLLPNSPGSHLLFSGRFSGSIWISYPTLDVWKNLKHEKSCNQVFW